MSGSRTPKGDPSPPPPTTVQDTSTSAPRSFTSATRPRIDGQSQLHGLHDHHRSTFGHRRKHSPNLEWKQPWNKDSWAQGRVLLIDYVASEHSVRGRRKILAQEFCDIDSLRRFYRKEDVAGQAALRVIHVQNASWATRYLLRKFNIDATDDLIGTNFGRWAREEKPQQRGGKPVLNGRTFRAQRDPWRGISRAAFGADYLKSYDRETHIPFPNHSKPIMELNHYDETDQPRYGYDVYVQRLSVYVQYSDGMPGQAVDPDIPNPYDDEAWDEYMRLKKSYGNVNANEHQDKYIPKLRSLDNGNTIILFENSVTGSIKDTLVGARQELESRWRRLSFYLPHEESDETLTAECMDFILQDIFKALAYNWHKFLGLCETHVGILEDKIYENPADESRAPELWKNSAQWLKVERLIYLHVDLIKEMVTHLYDLAGADPKKSSDQPWLGFVPDELDKLTGQWDRDVIQPTTALSDLMYKSVGIRDARHSLQLGLSMWRLSWITFIFLPLTFTVGFFGMNVSTFENNPPLKWWFIVSVPVLVTVMILWYGVKHNLASQRQNPMRRGVYESLYHELATAHSSLWTRGGPRPDVVPVGWWGGVKWRLLTTWFGEDKLKLGRPSDPATEEFGTWSRTKRYLARRWLDELAVMPIPQTTSDEHSRPQSSGSTHSYGHFEKDPGVVRELLHTATPVGIAAMDPTAASRLQKLVPPERLRSLSPKADKRSASAGSRVSSDGGIMVEEEKSGEEDAGGKREGRLNVPR
ncbi:CorA Mg2+ and Co2+ transporter [Pyrenophora tritici-repentis]|nr:CorA Mg2+ and Co2+ transporter [Pyrenophora tritici-repentis]KAI1544435.1 CorA Mg2+ and Co2+ transporter [Pyrenophora tritici-repentis]KAI1547795.1 CorA Mg2+ and Co2+ transporter [Pyrenophora tritici-repentis]KAI1582359.1 CorA Mg2+ and Co2+ transporter [Pyrenophora tritici-repentis]KAI1673336.1 CorA Mg2+ transporter protein [Pyrenophora tritici-repentis]